MAASQLVRSFLVMALAVSVPACARHCVPNSVAGSAGLLDLCAAPDAHAPAGSDPTRAIAAEFRRRAAAQHPPKTAPYHFLALSSGGQYGSYGVGVLKGWTDSGTRPTFDVVTGVSAGALMSTFAFLGSEYDETMRENMVGIKRRDFLRLRSLLAIPLSGSLFTSRPLARRIEKAITPALLASVAAAHAQGRRLYVATTNLDSREMVLWDMGAIASRGTEEALRLYRDIILASSSIPVVFPPVKLKVEIDGVCHDELHADGAASDDVVFRSFMVADRNRTAGSSGASAPAGSTLHIINNGKLFADPGCVRGLLGIFNASSSTITYNKSRDELYRIYLKCLETGVEFRSTEVPRDLPVSTTGLSVAAENQELLYRTGYQAGLRAATGEGWRDIPPGLDPAEEVLPRAGTHFATVGADKHPASVKEEKTCATGMGIP